ncbi:MAG: hypothetical protein JW864_18015 [Spirochaetes bacterium]|nr:hypothetical protein [Spirochaetota bacterium]
MKNRKLIISIIFLVSALIITTCSGSGGSNDQNVSYIGVTDCSLDNKSNVSIYASIEFRISGTISENSINSDFIAVTGNEKQAYGCAVYDNYTMSIVFIPYKPLDENCEYTITMSDDTEVASGILMEEACTFTFSTGEYIADTTGDIKVFCNYESGYTRKDLTLTFTTEETDAVIQTGWTKDLSAAEPDEWSAGETFAFSQVESYGTVRIFARAVKDSLPVGDNFTFVYKLMDKFPPIGANTEGIYKTDECMTDWATSIHSFEYGYDVEDKWKGTDQENLVLGPATGDNFDVFVTGNHGELTLYFDSGISDGTGYDLVVFENGFISEGGAGVEGQIFAEVFYVEVSSNGTDFVRFDNVSLTPEPVGGYGTLDTGLVNGLGGLQPNAYRISHYGSPFDLAWLRNKKEVLSGTVDLSDIRYVRMIDIPGTDGTEGIDLNTDKEGNTIDGYKFCYDSFGNIIRDAFRTWGSGGADIEAVGVIHTAE